MKKKILEKLLAIFMIITILSTDFLVLGSSLISYAANIDSTTNNENVEFSAYFKDENGGKIDKIEQSIKNSEMKLYLEIKVKNEGYFNGRIEIQNSNFKIKNNNTSSYVNNITENTIELNQINAGNNVEIELNIEPIITETLPEDMLSRDTTIKLTGTYMEQTYKGIDIEASKTVNLNLKIDDSAQAELSTEIITNKIFSINGENKRIVQLLIKSRLTENQYPIKETFINIGIPTLGENTAEDVKVLSLGTLATNGSTETTIDNWENKDGNVKIILPNKVNSNNEISWKKDVYDEIVVTFIYPEEVDAEKIEIKTTSEIQIYNGDNKYTAEHTVGIENKELNNIITSTSEVVTNDLYKGQLYANTTSSEKKEIPFSTETTLDIRYIDISDKITIQESKDRFVSESTSVDANTRYISTEINKDNMLNILGQDGTIQIKSGDIIYNLNKDAETDENGNIVINYDTTINELEIITSKPINEGKLVIYHNKAMMPNSYTIDEIREFTNIEIGNTIIASLGEENILETTTETQGILNETISKAELTVDKESLSTLTTNEQVNIGVKLITDGVQYDLYKNPTLKIQLPSSVESINVNSINKLYGDEFDIKANYIPSEKVISINLTGEQLSYPENSATQLYIQINLDITLSKLTPSKTDKISLTYTNEKGLIYDGGTTESGTIEKLIGISSQSGLMVMSNSNTYNINGISGISENKQTIQILSSDSGKEVNFDIALVNNTGTDISNIRILGKLPTDGNKITNEENVNTFTTTLKNAITAPNATVYYSENAEANTDISDTVNGWTTDLSTLTNPRVYLIICETLLKESSYTANYSIQLPNEITRDQMSATEFKVIYDTVGEKDAEINSTIIQFITPTAINMETNLVAEVGNDKLNSGDKVKAGEVIKYTVTVKNTGAQTIENINVKSGIPSGTVYVEPEEDYPYTGSSYYVERTDITEVVTNISTLASNETYTFTYEVRVKNNINNNDEILNKVTAICGDTSTESNEIRNTLETSQIRVTIKRTIDLETQIITGEYMRYLVFVENLSSEPIKNLQLNCLFDNMEIKFAYNEDYYMVKDEVVNRFMIDEIPANDCYILNIGGTTLNNSNTVTATAIVTDSQNNTYRSNKCIDILARADAEITLSSPTNGEYITENDIVEYNITVKNTGDITIGVEIKDEISEYFEVQEIYIDGVLKLQTTNTSDTLTYVKNISNTVSEVVALGVGKSKEIKIIAKVKTLNKDIDIENIVNTAQISMNDIVKNTSNEVVHYLQGNLSDDVKNIISGKAWLDLDLDGELDDNETLLSGIKVRIYDVLENDYLRDDSGNIKETITDSDGKYKFTKIKNGTYIILFEYDMENYEPTVYKKEGISDSRNSKVILKNISINGEQKTYAVTDTYNIETNLYNINIGLKEKVIFDLELNKYINSIVIQNSKGSKKYDYGNSTFEKIEIPSKQINGSVLVFEYKIVVKNNGEIPGYITNIVDYLPDGMTFSSELNTDWYLSNNNLYTKKFENERINPGEEKEIKLILTKTLTGDNIGLINNRAEIYECYNEKGALDIDSIPNNQANNEDDLGSVDIIIMPGTGATIIMYILLVIINMILITIAIRLIIKNSKRRVN